MKKLMAFIVIVLVITLGISFYRKQDMFQIQEQISKELIRFHVRANSDTAEDQELKLKVKDSVVSYLEPLLNESESLSQTREILSSHIDDIHQVATSTLTANASDYPVDIYFETDYFPMKSYGDITLPPGDYEAFRIDIGGSEGKNWWCVLYPPLCFVDATHGTLPDSSKDKLKNIFTEKEYNAVTNKKVKFEFKYLTFLNRFIN